MKAPRLMVLTKLMVVGARLPVTRTPAEAGLAFEDVAFKSSDDVDLKGWFIPAAAGGGPAPTVLFVHGWLWNRMGNVSGRVPFTDRDVDFLPPTKALHDAGFNVLLFDLSNHGESGRRLPLTFGPFEARDFVGAVRYLRTRARRRRLADRRGRHVDGRQHRPHRLGRVPADQGDAAGPADQALQLLRGLRRRRDGQDRLRQPADGRRVVRPRPRPSPEHDRPRRLRRAAPRHPAEVRPGHRRPLGLHGRSSSPSSTAPPRSCPWSSTRAPAGTRGTATSPSRPTTSRRTSPSTCRSVVTARARRTAYLVIGVGWIALGAWSLTDDRAFGWAQVAMGAVWLVLWWRSP